MALTSTFTTNPVKSIIVNQTQSTSATGVGDNNVAGGPTYLISAKIVNTNNGSSTYTKFYDATSATAGTDTASFVYRNSHKDLHVSSSALFFKWAERCNYKYCRPSRDYSPRNTSSGNTDTFKYGFVEWQSTK